MFRIGHQRESSSQFAVGHIIHFPAGRGRALLGQNPEIISVKGMRSRAVMRDITLGKSFRHQRPKRAGRFALLRRPIEAIFFAGRTLELLGVIQRCAGDPDRIGILLLRSHISPANADGAEFILANVAVDDFLFARRRVKIPLPAHLHNGIGYGQLFVPTSRVILSSPSFT